MQHLFEKLDGFSLFQPIRDKHCTLPSYWVMGKQKKTKIGPSHAPPYREATI
jgi:hypothetical protein